MPSLPTPGGSNNTWGQELNDFLTVSHNTDGTLKATTVSAITGLQAALDSKIGNTGSPTPVTTMWVGTQALYDAIATKSPATLYFILSSGAVLGATTYHFTANLKPGARSNEVLELQKKLLALGYTIKNQNGYFGVQTTAAVKAFQKAHRMTADGKVGPKTRAILNQ